MSGSKAVRSGEDPASKKSNSEHHQPQTAEKEPVAKIIRIPRDELAHNPFRYLSDPPKLNQKRKVICGAE
jgi:hypothetical protein